MYNFHFLQWAAAPGGVSSDSLNGLNVDFQIQAEPQHQRICHQLSRF